MTLTDTGPLVALIDKSDFNHDRCVRVCNEAELPLVSTLACITEAMYLLGRSAGFPGQEALWRYVAEGLVAIVELTEIDLIRCRHYMTSFRDLPCDFADSSLLAIAERLGSRHVLTLDGHFYAYRVLGEAISVEPGPRGR